METEKINREGNTHTYTHVHMNILYYQTFHDISYTPTPPLPEYNVNTSVYIYLFMFLCAGRVYVTRNCKLIDNRSLY